MATNIITQEDLEVFKNEFFTLFKTQFKEEFLAELKTFFESKEKNKILEYEGKRYTDLYDLMLFLASIIATGIFGL
jgi:hypothetical protein